MIISAIAAMSKNRVIGKDNKLPWHIPEDLKWFRDKTRGKPVIMGRKTFDSLGKPLPNRTNVVITRTPNDLKIEGAQVVGSIEEAIKLFKNEIGEVFIIGGGEIYKQAMPFTDRIYLTVIDQEYEGDACFPEFDVSQFRVIEKLDRTDPVPFSFITYDRISATVSKN